MIITGSLVSMSSSHKMSQSQFNYSAEAVMTSDKAEALSFSEESKYSYVDQLDHQVAIYEKADTQNSQKNLYHTLADLAKANRSQNCSAKAPTTEETIIQKILRLIENMQGKKKHFDPQSVMNHIGKSNANADLFHDMFSGYTSEGLGSGAFMSASFSQSSSQAINESISVSLGNISIGDNGQFKVTDGTSAPAATTWTKVSASSSYYTEMESTTYAATGIARTADGRELNFNVEMEMSRAFSSATHTFQGEAVIMTDPLVINVGSDVATISDQKFKFDLDSDGKDDEISFAINGSGFLALDKNNDGKINNGSELFGTKSGDGFKDLAAYDEDGNGWIDEADSVFKNLKVYSKDENGNDKLIDLKKAGVGAIYLGNASTHFSLNKLEDNSINGAIRSTGVFLKENGGVGTIQHVDLAV